MQHITFLREPHSSPFPPSEQPEGQNLRPIVMDLAKI